MNVFRRILGLGAAPESLPEARVLSGDWGALRTQLANDPRSAKAITDLERQLSRRFPGLSLAELPSRMVQGMSDLLIEHAGDVFGGDVQHELKTRDAVVIDLDDPLAEAQLSARGGHLILISSGLLTAMRFYSATFACETAARSQETRDSCLAVLRFYHLQQDYFGLSAVHAPARLPRTVWRDSEILASMFVLAHEIAHHALHHTSGGEAWSPDQELEADRWAGRLVRSNPLSIVVTKGRQERSLRGIYVALTVLTGRESARFLRAPSPHPSLSERWGAATDGAKNASGVWADSGTLRSLASAADRMHDPLPASHWSALRESRLWRGHLRDPGVYEAAAVLDALNAAPLALVFDVAEGLRALDGDSPVGVVLERVCDAFRSPRSLVGSLRDCGVSVLTSPESRIQRNLSARTDW